MVYTPGDILLDKYRIEALLGMGAFGEVYYVTHLGLNVTRALKVLRRDAPGVGSAEFNDGQLRFALEAQLGAQLNLPSLHLNLLQVHNFEKSGDLLALEMEYASGGSLAERLSKARDQGKVIPPEKALQIALDVASGLAVLHTHDIVHRDLKPANILFDGQGRAKLADLGLAQIPGGPSLRSQLSNPNPHPGTPGYMSPEQEHAGGLLKPPSDVYALGLVLFEMLTGRNYALLRPGTQASSLQPTIPAAADALLTRMLAPDAKDRPWDGRECVELLRGCLDLSKLSPISVSPLPKAAAPLSRPKKFRSGWLLIAALLAFGFLIVFGVIFWTFQNNKAVVVPTQTLFTSTETAVSVIIAAPLATLTATTAPTDIPAQITHTDTAKPIDTPPIVTAVLTNIPAKITHTDTPTTALDIGSTLTREKDGMIMMYVPEGPFTMGSETGQPDEKPAHIVTLDAFWIDQTEVTNSKYALCVQAGVCQPPLKISSATRNWYYGNADYANYPVIYVDWNHAKTYCKWVVSSLPTEAQWEKAARGTDQRIYPWGNSAPTCDMANFSSSNNTCIGDTSAVGKYISGASSYGALDMAGNVWEWVADWYDRTYYQNFQDLPAFNPIVGSSSGQSPVLRGGSWPDEDVSIRSTDRFWSTPSNTFDLDGFRCASSP